MYFPPKHNLKRDQYEYFLNHFGQRYVIGGDYNAKNEAWGSRPVHYRNQNMAHVKGRELLQAIHSTHSNCISGGRPTYWPSDKRKKPDIILFHYERYSY